MLRNLDQSTCRNGDSIIASNGSGFSALPRESRVNEGWFGGIKCGSLWWALTLYSTIVGWIRAISAGSREIFKSYIAKNRWQSVRCVID